MALTRLVRRPELAQLVTGANWFQESNPSRKLGGLLIQLGLQPAPSTRAPKRPQHKEWLKEEASQTCGVCV